MVLLLADFAICSPGPAAGRQGAPLPKHTLLKVYIATYMNKIKVVRSATPLLAKEDAQCLAFLLGFTPLILSNFNPSNLCIFNPLAPFSYFFKGLKAERR